MHINKLTVKGFRIFEKEFSVTLNKGLNILVGENACGKSAVVDSIRLLLHEDEYGRAGVEASDFHKPHTEKSKATGSQRISIRAEIAGLSADQQVAFLPWLDLNNPESAILNLAIENREDSRGRFKKKIWGNESVAGLFEWELLETIHCIYLPPLRDAEGKLRAFKGSRLARLLKNLREPVANGDLHPLEQKFALLNKDLLKDASIKQANEYIKENILKSIGGVFGQDTSLQFSEISFDRIVERIRLLFYPVFPKSGGATPLDMFRELNENSLGFNNILYLATILTELDRSRDEDTFQKVLLIEEPEAHLHPQLQIRLMQFLEEKAREENIQIIVTTHSPTLTSGVPLNTVKVFSLLPGDPNPCFTDLAQLNLGSYKKFVERWLDITKSILLFAKGVLFVEGIAEALVVKELSSRVLQKLQAEYPERLFFNNLEDYGVSIINLNGIYFRHFFSLFQGYENADGTLNECKCIPIRCAGLTDNDPEPETKPTKLATAIGTNYQLPFIHELQTFSGNCRLFSNLKTFEYDLGMEANNLAVMCRVQLRLLTKEGSIKDTLTRFSVTDWSAMSDFEKAEASYYLLERIDKGIFAQSLAEELSDEAVSFEIPAYITDAVKWLVGDGQ